VLSAPGLWTRRPTSSSSPAQNRRTRQYLRYFFQRIGSIRPWGSRGGAIKSYPWREEPSGNSLERARFNRIRLRSITSASASMARSKYFVEAINFGSARDTLMIVKAVRINCPGRPREAGRASMLPGRQWRCRPGEF
jgi:hypothetical protein